AHHQRGGRPFLDRAEAADRRHAEQRQLLELFGERPEGGSPCRRPAMFQGPATRPEMVPESRHGAFPSQIKRCRVGGPAVGRGKGARGTGWLLEPSMTMRSPPVEAGSCRMPIDDFLWLTKSL